MENNKLTDDIIFSIQSLIEKFGGIDNTVIITGVSKSSLIKYLNKKVDIISNNVWNEKLAPYMQPTLYDKISDRINMLKDELNDYHEGFLNALNEKYTENKKIKENSIDYETLENILDNPIHSLRENYINVDAFEDLNNLKNTIIELSNNKNYSKYVLLAHMVNFRNIYEKFRPPNITNSDVYFGTVKKIEELFVVLFWYIGIEPLFYFSKVDHTYIKSGNYSHEKIDWNLILADVESLINSISIKIEEKAFDLLCKLKKHTPSYCRFIIYQIISRFFNGADMEKINFDFDNNKLIIDKTLIEIDNYWSIKFKMIKILESKNSV